MAMRLSNIRMTTKVDRNDLLKQLRDNLTKHQAIVAEAKAGYLIEAKKRLEIMLQKVEKGEVFPLQSSLTVPPDHSEVYLNSIAMLEWNRDAFVELEADEFRQLVRDEWDWTDTFYGSSSAYSSLAREELTKKKM